PARPATRVRATTHVRGGGIDGHLGGAARPGAGGRPRQLLRPGGPFAAGDAGDLPDPAIRSRAAALAGVPGSAHRGRAGGADRVGTTSWSRSAGGTDCTGFTGGRSAALLRPGAFLVSRPVGAVESGLPLPRFASPLRPPQ